MLFLCFGLKIKRYNVVDVSTFITFVFCKRKQQTDL